MKLAISLFNIFQFLSAAFITKNLRMVLPKLVTNDVHIQSYYVSLCFLLDAAFSTSTHSFPSSSSSSSSSSTSYTLSTSFFCMLSRGNNVLLVTTKDGRWHLHCVRKGLNQFFSILLFWVVILWGDGKITVISLAVITNSSSHRWGRQWSCWVYLWGTEMTDHCGAQRWPNMIVSSKLMVLAGAVVIAMV